MNKIIHIKSLLFLIFYFQLTLMYSQRIKLDSAYIKIPVNFHEPFKIMQLKNGNKSEAKLKKGKYKISNQLYNFEFEISGNNRMNGTVVKNRAGLKREIIINDSKLLKIKESFRNKEREHFYNRKDSIIIVCEYENDTLKEEKKLFLNRENHRKVTRKLFNPDGSYKLIDFDNIGVDYNKDGTIGTKSKYVLFPFYFNGKWGLIDENKKIIVKANYEQFFNVSNKFFIVSNSNESIIYQAFKAIKKIEHNYGIVKKLVYNPYEKTTNVVFESKDKFHLVNLENSRIFRSFKNKDTISNIDLEDEELNVKNSALILKTKKGYTFIGENSNENIECKTLYVIDCNGIDTGLCFIDRSHKATFYDVNFKKVNSLQLKQQRITKDDFGPISKLVGKKDIMAEKVDGFNIDISIGGSCQIPTFIKYPKSFSKQKKSILYKGQKVKEEETQDLLFIKFGNHKVLISSDIIPYNEFMFPTKLLK